MTLTSRRIWKPNYFTTPLPNSSGLFSNHYSTPWDPWLPIPNLQISLRLSTLSFKLVSTPLSYTLVEPSLWYTWLVDLWWPWDFIQWLDTSFPNITCFERDTRPTHTMGFWTVWLSMWDITMNIMTSHRFRDATYQKWVYLWKCVKGNVNCILFLSFVLVGTWNCQGVLWFSSTSWFMVQSNLWLYHWPWHWTLCKN